MARQLRELIAGRGAAGGDGSSPRQTTSAGRAAPTGLQLIYRGESA
jgi:hypothetical protein